MSRKVVNDPLYTTSLKNNEILDGYKQMDGKEVYKLRPKFSQSPEMVQNTSN